MVPITFRFIIRLTWCHHRPITSPWNLLTEIVMIIINISSSSRISIEFLMRNTILALDDLCYHRPFDCLPFNTNLFVFCVIPWDPCYPTFVLLYLGVLPSFMSRMLREFHHLLRILDIGDTSCHIRSFLGREFKSSSNPFALKLLVDISFLDRWLSNHHSNIDHAT